MSVDRNISLKAASVIFCLLSSGAFSEEYATDVGPLKVYYDERFPMFDGLFGSDYGGVRIVFANGSEIPFSDENESAVRSALIAYCTDATGLADFDEFVFVRGKMVGRCLDTKTEEQ